MKQKDVFSETQALLKRWSYEACGIDGPLRTLAKYGELPEHIEELREALSNHWHSKSYAAIDKSLGCFFRTGRKSPLRSEHSWAFGFVLEKFQEQMDTAASLCRAREGLSVPLSINPGTSPRTLLEALWLSRFHGPWWSGFWEDIATRVLYDRSLIMRFAKPD